MKYGKIRSRIAIIALACALAASLGGCKDKDDINNSNGTAPAEASNTIAKENGDNNNAKKEEDDSAMLENTDEELYSALGSAERALICDELAFYNGEVYQYRLNARIITTEPAAGDALQLDDIKDGIDKIVIGDKNYSINELVRDQSEGLEIVKLFARDFGLNRCTPEGILIERLGDVSESDDLRSLYSDRVDFNDQNAYTACAYYFDVKLGNYDAADYDNYRAIYKENYGSDTGFNLDGKLGVVLYYDSEGNDYFYSIVISAPGYYSNEKNFRANMGNSLRKDITNCHILTTDGLKAGLTDNIMIMCGGNG